MSGFWQNKEILGSKEIPNKEACIAAIVAGKTFADVGGLWGTKGEMCTHAVKAGARACSMIDAMPKTSIWWSKFKEHCDSQNIFGVDHIVANIGDPRIKEKTGLFDIVHCSGVMYHVPDVVGFISNLLSITDEYLILTSQVLPERIENHEGSLNLTSDLALCTPCLSSKTRSIINAYYQGCGRNIPSFSGKQTFFTASQKPNYGPWWWLFTSGFMDKILEIYNVSMVWKKLSRDSSVYTVLLKKLS